MNSQKIHFDSVENSHLLQKMTFSKSTSDFEILGYATCVLVIFVTSCSILLVGVPNQCFLHQIIVFKVGGWVGGTFVETSG